MWIRMADRHRLRVDFYEMSRKGDIVMDQVVRFGDTTFLPGERVVSDMSLGTLRPDLYVLDIPSRNL